MMGILASQSNERRAKGEALITRPHKPSCESWNESMCSDCNLIDPSPILDQAINGRYTWLRSSVPLQYAERCRFGRDEETPITLVHCITSGLASGTLLQLARRPRQVNVGI
jgi:hypothetical protein